MKKGYQLIIIAVTLIALILGSLVTFRYFQVKSFTKNLSISLNDKQYQNDTVSNRWQNIVKAKARAIEMGIPKNAYGYLKIPSVNLKLPIFRGTNDYTLSIGVATYYYDDAEAGKNNIVLAGHTTPYEGVLLTNLSSVSEGDKIGIETADKTYQYTVDTIQVIDDEIEITDSQLPTFLALPKATEKAKITLFTCVDWQNNSQRLVVNGHLN
jgi:sortase A